MLKNNPIKTIVALFIILCIVIVLPPATNTAKAIDPAMKWYPGITAAPDTVGVGQRVLIVAGFTFATSSYTEKCYSGWTITVTKPDGTVRTLGPYTCDPTGYFFAELIPDVTGIWKLQAHYPGGIVDYIDVKNCSVPAADTDVISLTVQQEPIPNFPDSPLPQEYWTYPINAQNRNWNVLAGSWLMPGGISGGRAQIYGGAFNPYTTVPNAGHVLWTKPTLFGGVVGGETNMDYYAGSSYRPEMFPPVIMNGRLYYIAREPPREGWYCVDFYTGEQIWFVNGTYPDGKGGLVQGASAQISLGQILTLDNRNWHGGIPYLWSTGATTWAVWDAWTGALLYTVINAPNIGVHSAGVTLWTDPETGALFTFIHDTSTNTFVRWNSTKMIDASGVAGETLANLGRENPMFNIDWKKGIEWNVSLPVLKGNTGRAAWLYDPNDYSVIVMSNQSRGYANSATAFEDMAVSGIDGHVMWRKIRNEGTWEEVSGGNAMSISNDVFARLRKETKELYAYSVSTGAQLWVAKYDNFWSTFQRGPYFAYDKLINTGYDGEIWAHEAKTGKVVWKWGPVDSGLETPYGDYPFIGGITVADHKIMIATNEHSGDVPLYRGEKMYVIDADNGTTLWSELGWYQWPIPVNGYILAPNGYDGQIYNFGKGPSQTTVTASPKTLTYGTTVQIEGSILDISPGTKQTQLAARFPNGVPAVSDESQSQWMEYLYQQQTKPTNTTGVTVTLSVLDSNGNYRDIGTTTANADGFFSFDWKPDIEGKFTVTATFAGSESYWPSHAVTAFNVDATGPTASPIPVAAQPPTEMYIAAAAAAIIIAVAIGFAITILTLRKRP
jgi:hypothetical protein